MISIFNRQKEKEFNEKIIKILNRKEIKSSEILEKVKVIVEKVKHEKDKAVLEFTKKFDKASLVSKELKVSVNEINKAHKIVKKDVIKSLEKAYENILEFHNSLFESSKFLEGDGYLVGQIIRPLKRVGLYIPGGRAPLVSTVLMNAVPAKLAGVKELVMTTPPNPKGEINPYLLTAAKMVGIDSIYKIGGAQAIAAMAYGTETIPKVDKIVGPGNVYVAQAKKYVFGDVDIDMIAGPSEILIIADESANPEYIASDLLSQAEHDELASSILITTSLKIAQKVKKEIENQLKTLERKQIASESLLNYGAIFTTENLEKAISLANEFAPEHLELHLKEPFLWLGKIENAGAIFIGSYSPEACGDYIAGPNHVLPTGGTSKFFSPLGVYDFIKRSSIIYYSQKKLIEMSPHIMAISEIEGLTAHTLSVKKRTISFTNW